MKGTRVRMGHRLASLIELERLRAEAHSARAEWYMVTAAQDAAWLRLTGGAPALLESLALRTRYAVSAQRMMVEPPQGDVELVDLFEAFGTFYALASPNIVAVHAAVPPARVSGRVGWWLLIMAGELIDGLESTLDRCVASELFVTVLIEGDRLEVVANCAPGVPLSPLGERGAASLRRAERMAGLLGGDFTYEPGPAVRRGSASLRLARVAALGMGRVG